MERRSEVVRHATVTSDCIVAPHYSTLHYMTFRYISLHYMTFRYITLHYMTFRYIALYYITLHCIAVNCIALHCIALKYSTVQYSTVHYIKLPRRATASSRPSRAARRSPQSRPTRPGASPSRAPQPQRGAAFAAKSADATWGVTVARASATAPRVWQWVAMGNGGVCRSERAPSRTTHPPSCLRDNLRLVRSRVVGVSARDADVV